MARDHARVRADIWADEDWRDRMLTKQDADGRPLYKKTSGGNISRTRKLTKIRKQRVHERDGFACVLCGSRAELQVDHIIRYADGGGNAMENLRTLCAKCHGKRGGRP